MSARDPDDGVIEFEPHEVWVGDLRPGDLVDLEGDPFVEPNGSDAEGLPYELVEVCEPIVHETNDCVRVGFEGLGAYGFPIGHALWVCAHDTKADSQDEQNVKQ